VKNTLDTHSRHADRGKLKPKHGNGSYPQVDERLIIGTGVFRSG